MLETSYILLNYKVNSNIKLECLKIRRIGQSAAKIQDMQGYKPALNKVQRLFRMEVHYYSGNGK